MSSAARTTRPPQPVPVAPSAAAWGRPVARFTVEQYHRMIDAGVFVGARRCELIHGLILEKSVPGPPHCSSTRRLARRLMALFPEPGWVTGVQDSITLSGSEPEPDFFAAVGPEDNYADRHPGPKDLVLVVEVADSSVAFDRGAKLALYAGSKVTQYWIVDVNARRVEVYTDPRGGKNPTYRTQTDYGPGDAVPVVVGGTELGSIPVSELLP
ncbi:MAG: Uma2 family endonuclease [Gemmataceae bacterium]|nr:Uma2 family endonuclease [Gemmataceae bacterium]